jgi:membrane-associated phospholipid phosphatase
MGPKKFPLAHLIGLLSLLTSVVSFQPTPPRATFTVYQTALEDSESRIRRRFVYSMSPDEVGPSPFSENESLPVAALRLVGSTTSAVVALTFFGVLAYQRDALMVSFFIGAISNGILSKVAKKVLKQARPANLDAASLDLVPSDNGMPSSHAMSLGFIGVFAALHLPWTTIPLFLYCLVSLVYRVKINLHSLDQVLVGVTLGSINGYTWRALSHGTNPFNINIMDWVSMHFLNENGLLPWYGLAIPALLGAAVVGSFERRLSWFLKKRSQDDKIE